MSATATVTVIGDKCPHCGNTANLETDGYKEGRRSCEHSWNCNDALPTRVVSIEDASVGDIFGHSDAVYQLVEKTGSPKEIGAKIAEALEVADFASGNTSSVLQDGGSIVLDIRVKITAVKQKPVNRFAGVVVHPAGPWDQEDLAIEAGHNLGIDWLAAVEMDDEWYLLVKDAK